VPVDLDNERWLTFWTRFNLNRWPSQRPANEPQVVVDGMCDRQAINAYTQDTCGHDAEDCFDRRGHSPILPPAKRAHMPLVVLDGCRDRADTAARRKDRQNAPRPSLAATSEATARRWEGLVNSL
jgi:hypothetical protein